MNDNIDNEDNHYNDDNDIRLITTKLRFNNHDDYKNHDKN